MDVARARKAIVEVIRAGVRRGTGFFVDDGVVLTCDHVAVGDGPLEVRLSDGTLREASIVASLSVPDLDVCALAVSAKAQSLIPVTLQPANIGDPCWTAGFFGTASVTDSLPSTGSIDGPTSTRYGDQRSYEIRGAIRVRDLGADFGASGSPLLALPEGVAVAITIAKFLTRDNLAVPFGLLRGTTLGRLLERTSSKIAASGRYLNYAGARELCSAQRASAVQRLIDSGQYLPRRFVQRKEISKEIKIFLTQRDRIVLPIVGASGVGKSSLLAHFADRTQRPFLILLAGHRVTLNSDGLRQAINQELREVNGQADDVDRLARAASAAGKPLVVLFDALNEIVGSRSLLRAWMERSLSWLASSEAVMIVSARSDFWESIADLVPERFTGNERPITLGDFSDEEATLAVSAYRVKAALIDQGTLRRPIFLRLYAELAAVEQSGRVRLIDLFRRYVADKARQVTRQLNTPMMPALIERLLERIGSQLDGNLAIAADAAALDDVTAEVLHALLAENILLHTEDGFRLVFDEVAEYLRSKGTQLPDPGAAEWGTWLAAGPVPGVVRFSLLQTEDSDPERARSQFTALTHALAALASEEWSVRYHQVLYDTFAWLMNPPVDLLLDYLRSSRATIYSEEMVWLVPAIESAAITIRERLDLLHAAAPILGYYPWREKDWIDKQLIDYPRDFGAPLFAQAFAGALSEDAPVAIDALVEWLDDALRLRGDHSHDQTGEACVSDVAAALLYQARDSHFEVIANALAERLRRGRIRPAESLLMMLGSACPAAVQPVVLRWVSAGPDRHMAAIFLLNGTILGTKTPPPTWSVEPLLQLAQSQNPLVSVQAFFLLGYYPEQAATAFEVLAHRFLEGDADVNIWSFAPFSVVPFDRFLAFTRTVIDQPERYEYQGQAIVYLAGRTLSPVQHEVLVAFLIEVSAREELRDSVAQAISSELEALPPDDTSFDRLVDLACRFVRFGGIDGVAAVCSFLADHDNRKAEAQQLIIEAVITTDDRVQLQWLSRFLVNSYRSDDRIFYQLARLVGRLEHADTIWMTGAFQNTSLARDLLHSNVASPLIDEFRRDAAAGKPLDKAARDILMRRRSAPPGPDIQ